MSGRISVVLIAALLLKQCHFGESMKSLLAVMRIEENGYIFRCSGVLISEKEVLTACSCVSAVIIDIETSKSKLTPFHAKDIMVLLGKSLKVESEESSRVSFLNLHPRCNIEYEHDLAVLHTIEPLKGGESLIAKLPSQPEISGKMSGSCVTSAWGISQNIDENLPEEKPTNPLDNIQVKFLDNSKCQDLVCVLDVNAVCDPDLSNFKCIESTDGTSICSTDSGAPVFCNGVLVGITSLQKVIDSNCDDEKLSRRSLVVSLNENLDFVVSSLSASKPTTPKVQWAPGANEAPIDAKPSEPAPNRKPAGRSIDDNLPTLDDDRKSSERMSSSRPLKSQKFPVFFMFLYMFLLY